jgi:hypothetical protein
MPIVAYRFSIFSHQRDAVRLPHPILRNNELWMSSFQYRSGVFKPGRTSFATISCEGAHLSPQSETSQQFVTVLVTIGGFDVFNNNAV